MGMFNKVKLAVSCYSQVAALALDMFFIFYLVKNHKNFTSFTTTEARQK